MTITASLVAVFIPLLLMGGIVGRLFREFAITLTAAIIISLLLSLTTTPMMCAYLIRASPAGRSTRTAWQTGGRHRRLDDAPLRKMPVLVRSNSRPDRAGEHSRDHLPELVPVQHRSQGILPRTGHRPASGRPAGRSDRVASRSSSCAFAVSSRSSRRIRRSIRWSPPMAASCRSSSSPSMSARRSTRSSRACVPRSPRWRARPCSSTRARRAGRRAISQTPPTNTPWKRTISLRCIPGRPTWPPPWKSSPR